MVCFFYVAVLMFYYVPFFIVSQQWLLLALTAPCGIDCFNCNIHEDNLTDDVAERVHARWGMPKEDIACKECRALPAKGKRPWRWPARSALPGPASYNHLPG